MKKIMIFITFIVLTLTINVKALSLDNNNIEIKSGDKEKVTLYANVDTNINRVTFSMTYTSYDIPGEFKVNDKFTEEIEGSVHTIYFDTSTSGKIKLGTINIESSDGLNNGNNGTISLFNAYANDEVGNEYNLDNQIINITINNNKVKEVNNTDKNLLKSINSKIVTISLKDNIFEYDVIVDKDLEELDLEAIPKDDSYDVEISNQKIKELKDNKIIITVTNGDIKQEYVIKVSTLKEVETLVLDSSKSKPSYKYKSKWVALIIIFSIILVIGIIINKKKK